MRRTEKLVRRRDVPIIRRKTCPLHVGRRAGCTPEDVPVVRCKTCRFHAGRRASCTSQDMPVARRKTCRLHAGRRADLWHSICEAQTHTVSSDETQFHTGHLSSSKTGRTTDVSDRGARRGGGAGSSRTGCLQIISPRRQASCH